MWQKLRVTLPVNRRNMHALFSVCNLRDDNVITRKSTWKLKRTNSILWVFWIFLTNVIKIDPYNFELYIFKIGAFWDSWEKGASARARARYFEAKTSLQMDAVGAQDVCSHPRRHAFSGRIAPWNHVDLLYALSVREQRDKSFTLGGRFASSTQLTYRHARHSILQLQRVQRSRTRPVLSLLQGNRAMRETTCDSNTRLCIASRGKNAIWAMRINKTIWSQFSLFPSWKHIYSLDTEHKNMTCFTLYRRHLLT